MLSCSASRIVLGFRLGTAVLVSPEQAQMTTFLLMLPARSNVCVCASCLAGGRVEFADQQKAIIGERHGEDQ